MINSGLLGRMTGDYISIVNRMVEECGWEKAGELVNLPSELVWALFLARSISGGAIALRNIIDEEKHKHGNATPQWQTLSESAQRQVYELFQSPLHGSNGPRLGGYVLKPFCDHQGLHQNLTGAASSLIEKIKSNGLLGSTIA